jgi:drug/metabolite transporter (DMT)-like permease
MRPTTLKSELILLLAAVIWGFAFVAQRVGMDYVGPFTFNGVRFFLGVLVVVPFLLRKKSWELPEKKSPGKQKILITGSILTGLFLFGGVALQQVGLQTTTAGKAGFLTGLYVVFVPVVGIFFHHKTGIATWLGVLLSIAGLFLLSVGKDFSINEGDFLVLLCAVIFSGHVLLISWLSPLMDSYRLAAVQFSVCAIISMIVALCTEQVTARSILNAAIPIGYGGIFSVGIAYTLQVIAQKKANPTHASIILSLEAVFAAIGGWLILNEHLTNRSLAGCLLMLCGMIVVQVVPQKPFHKETGDHQHPCDD